MSESAPVHQETAGASGERIYHVTTPETWKAAVVEGAYRLSTRGRTLNEVGFVHCSRRAQVLEVAERLYADRAELVLIAVDPQRLGSPVREENLDGGNQTFPHIYGPLELEAVTEALPMHRDADGRFRLPGGVPR